MVGEGKNTVGHTVNDILHGEDARGREQLSQYWLQLKTYRAQVVFISVLIGLEFMQSRAYKSIICLWQIQYCETDVYDMLGFVDDGKPPIKPLPGVS